MERPIIRRKIPRILFWLLIIYTACVSTVVLAIQFGLIQLPPRQLEAAGENLHKKHTACHRGTCFCGTIRQRISFLDARKRGIQGRAVEALLETEYGCARGA